VLAPQAGLAGPFQPERVASTAKWVVHLDAEAAMASQVVQSVLQQPDVAAKVAEGVKQVQAVAGLDLTKDIKSVTVYGADYTSRPGWPSSRQGRPRQTDDPVGHQRRPQGNRLRRRHHSPMDERRARSRPPSSAVSSART